MNRTPLLLLCLVLAACAGTNARNPDPPPPRLVVLCTDFGLKDDAVGLMRGVILSIARGARVVDLTHEVPRFSVAAGARLIAEAPGLYPRGTVFVVVVDPGVGTKRRAVVAELANGSYVVAPDNGVLTHVIARHGPAVVREVTNPQLVRKEMSSTFHGRDVFAPVGGHVANSVAFEAVGPVVTDWIRLKEQPPRREGKRLYGRVVAIDEPFGNVWTNLPGAWLKVVKGTQVRVRFTQGKRVVATLRLPAVATFGDVPQGKPLVYTNSRGKVSLARNMADFARTYRIKPGMQVRITR